MPRILWRFVTAVFRYLIAVNITPLFLRILGLSTGRDAMGVLKWVGIGLVIFYILAGDFRWMPRS